MCSGSATGASEALARRSAMYSRRTARVAAGAVRRLGAQPSPSPGAPAHREHDQVVVELRRPAVRLVAQPLGQRLRRRARGRARRAGRAAARRRTARRRGAPPTGRRWRRPARRRLQRALVLARRRRAASTPSGSPVVPQLGCTPPPARSSGGGWWPALRPAQRPPSTMARNAGTNSPVRQPRAQDRVRLREHLGRAVAVERARLDEEAHHRARSRRPPGPCR